MKHQKLLDDMWAAYEAAYNEKNHRRTYLGMSVSEENCGRKPWLEFRHAFDPHIRYDSASHFEDGHLSEDIIAERMRLAGINLVTEDENGGQFALSDMYWHRGHMDGKLPDLNALWEHKSTKDAKLLKLKKLIAQDESEALKKWDATYYDQATRYMGYSGVYKHILTASAHGSREKINSKGDYRTAIVETLFDEKHFEYLKSRAEHIIVSDKMPEAAWSLELDKPLCVWANGQCEAYDFCKGRHIGKPNCRNCGFVNFTTEGATCTKTGDELNEKEMVEFKECHRYHPNLIHSYDLIELDEAGVVHYRNDSGHELHNDNSLEFYEEFNNEYHTK